MDPTLSLTALPEKYHVSFGQMKKQFQRGADRRSAFEGCIQDFKPTQQRKQSKETKVEAIKPTDHSGKVNRHITWQRGQKNKP